MHYIALYQAIVNRLGLIDNNSHSLQRLVVDNVVLHKRPYFDLFCGWAGTIKFNRPDDPLPRSVSTY